MIEKGLYTSKLAAGLGAISETMVLLDLWEPGMSTVQLQKRALDFGVFPNISARRLKNLVVECFAHRYLIENGSPASDLKLLNHELRQEDFAQILLLYTCMANPILEDFVTQIYWKRYENGYIELSNQDARDFVERGIDAGRMEKRWAESVVKRVSSYLIGCLADFALLENKRASSRRILTFQIAPSTVVYLAYKLHFAGLGDNAVLSHKYWQIFGLDRNHVLESLKRVAVKGALIVQAAGGIVKINWKFECMEEVCDVLAKG